MSNRASILGLCLLRPAGKSTGKLPVPFLSLQGGHEDCPLTRLLGSNVVRRRMRSTPAVAQNYGATWPAGAGTPPGVKEFRESRKKAPSVCSNQAVDPVQCALLKTQLVASLQPISTIEGRLRMFNSITPGLPEELVEDLRETADGVPFPDATSTQGLVALLQSAIPGGLFPSMGGW